MKNASFPIVAVIGGLWQLDPPTAAGAKAAGKLIGIELAKSGFGLVVYYSTEDSLEPHVVSGYAATTNENLPAGAICVRYAESQRGKVKFNEQASRPELFEYRLFPGQDWEVPFYRSLAEEDGVDAVILLGGATSTFIAGQIAVARRLPILAVDEFGGAAAKIWNQLAQTSSTRQQYAWGSRTASKFVEELKQDCALIAQKRTAALRSEQFLARITAQRRQSAYAAAAFAALLASLFFGLVYTPFPSLYSFVILVGLISAGATGALVRVILSEHASNDSRTSLLLGGIAGFVVGLAYLIPQWVGAPGPLSPTNDVVSAVAKIQFASAVLVAVSAGVGFDTVFSRLQKQAQDVAVGPPR